MQVIAEGVETAEQEAYIISEGCHEGQGYHYSKPLPARELSVYLKQAQRSNAVIFVEDQKIAASFHSVGAAE